MITGFVRFFAVLSAILLTCIAPHAVGATDPESAPKRIPNVVGPVFHEVRSIPYPNGALYVSQGLNGAFMGGKHRNRGESQSLFQWQGELGYFYTPHLSGGVGFRITAGEPSKEAQKIFNRYFINLRFHQAWDKIALYVGPQLGVGNLNILTDSTSDSTKTAIGNVPFGEKIKITNTKPTLSLDCGGGWKFSRYLGATLGGNLEYSLVDEEGVGTTNALNLHINPGLSLDILSFTDTMQELVPAFYLNVEFKFGFLIFERSGHRQDQTAVMGIGLAF
ncbi:MAG: hypothetical protein M3Y08_03155 [Fibrobacterota bacterium]|nr:hypothetical protein [Fibrobacterota bacterium]